MLPPPIALFRSPSRRTRPGVRRLLVLGVCLAGSLAAGQADAQEARPLVLVLAGQSNMAGSGVSAELAPGDRAMPPNVTLLGANGESRPAAGPRFGPEVGVAAVVGGAMPERRLVLVKHAVGGTSMLAWSPAWDSTRAERTGNAAAGPLYEQLMRAVGRLPAGPAPEVGAVLWMQGERDAKFDEAAGSYYENLAGLIAAFRRDLGDPELPFLLGLINPPPGGFPFHETVRAAQRRAAREIPHVHLVETDGLSKRGDDLHYDTRGALELGRRFAASYLSLRQAAAAGGHPALHRKVSP